MKPRICCIDYPGQ